MSLFVALAAVAVVSAAPEEIPALQKADADYAAAIQKAEQELAKARRNAAEKRLKAYRDALQKTTRMGDFDAAAGIKARIEQYEEKDQLRPKPKDLAKFGKSEYAVIEDAATWHVAKRRCEEMGGHLATVETLPEHAFLVSLCREAGKAAWIGATAEEKEGDWRWITGERVTIPYADDNGDEISHHLVFWPSAGHWSDGNGAMRFAFVCEWE